MITEISGKFHTSLLEQVHGINVGTNQNFKSLNFLGGLSLHLNHLIQSRMEISHRLFGTLPIGLLLSNLDSKQLETSMTSYDQF